jgi:hypothetical protein
MTREFEDEQTLTPYVVALRTVREAIEELFGSMANIDSDEADSLRGPGHKLRPETIFAPHQSVSTRIHNSASVWRSMKSAPKDGRTFLIGIGDQVTSVYCNKDGDFC